MDAITLAAVVNDGTADGGELVCDELDCLPILRWSNTIGGLTSRVDDVSLFNPRSWFEAVPANITSIFLSIGNNLWAAAASVERMADGSSVMLDTFGKMANRFTGAVWSSLADWRILSMAIILIVGASLWQYLHNGTIQAFGQRMFALIMGLAMFATVGIASANNPDKPATLTPYWMVTSTNKYLGDIAGSASDALVQGFDSGGSFLAYDYSNRTSGDLLSCRNYLSELHRLNEKHMKSNGHARDTVLSAMNTMWEETALRIYARTQYGPGQNADQVFCRIPEYRAGATAQSMAYVSTQAVIDAGGGTVKWGGGTGNAMAWYPDLWEANLDDNDSTKVANEDVFLDRWVTMWDACGYGKQRKSLYIRDGWAFVNSIEGSDRGVDQDGSPTSEDTGADFLLQCRATIAAKTEKGGKTNSKLQPSTILKGGDSKECPADPRGNYYCKQQTGTASDDFKSMKALTNKFNIRTDSNWRTLSQTNNNTTDENTINAAKRTLSYQQGKVTASELGGAVVFSLSALVNLFIWGLGFGLIKMLTLALASLVAAGGLWLGLLLYALSPEKGKRAVLNAGKQMVGMCAAGSVIGLVGSAGCLFVTAAMAGLGLINGGSTTGNVTLLALASGFLPFVYLWAVRYICVNVWKIGDPFGSGLFRMMGGQALMNGLKTLGGAAVGGAAGALGAAMGGGGLKDMLGAAAHGAGLDRMRNPLGRALGTAMAAKDHTEMRNAMLGRKRGSAADQAAVDKDGNPTEAEGTPGTEAGDASENEAEDMPETVDDIPSDDEKSAAETAVRDKYRKELEAEGLEGDELDAAVDERMRSAEGLAAVDTLAERLHDEADVSDEDRAHARAEIFGKRSRELQKAGFKGDDLKRELDKYMDSDDTKAEIERLAKTNHEQRVYGDDIRQAEDAKRAELRERFAKQGLSGRGLDEAVDDAMGSDGVRMDILKAAHAAHAANAARAGGWNAPSAAELDADHKAAWEPSADELKTAGEQVRASVERDERERLAGTMSPDDVDFDKTLKANVDALMRTKANGEAVTELARTMHHDAYMAGMGERVAGLSPDARAVFDQRMSAEQARIMTAHPELGLAEVRARARENLLTESSMGGIERAGVRHALANMGADSMAANANDLKAAARTLGVSATRDQLDDATDMVRAEYTRQAAATGLSGTLLDRKVDGMRNTDAAREAVNVKALSLNPQIAGAASQARAQAVDTATVSLMRTGRFKDAAEARATAVMQNRLTGRYAAQGLSGRELTDKVASSMADPTVRARMTADADALRSDPRQTARFDRMLADANSTMRGRYETARMSGRTGVGSVMSAVGGTLPAQMAGAAVTSGASIIRSAAQVAADHPMLATAATAATMPVSLPATAMAATATFVSHTLLNDKGFVHRGVGKAAPLARNAAETARGKMDEWMMDAKLIPDATPLTVAIPQTATVAATVAAPVQAPMPVQGPARRGVSGTAVPEPMAEPTAGPAVPSFKPETKTYDGQMPPIRTDTADGRRIMREAYGQPTVDVMTGEGLTSPDVATRLVQGETLLPQPRGGYTDETAAESIAYGTQDVDAPSDVEARVTPASPQTVLGTMAGTPAVKRTVDTWARTVGLDGHAARHFDKHPRETLDAMGIRTDDAAQAAQVVDALNRLDATQGADAVARLARETRKAGGMDGADILDRLRKRA